MENTIPCLGFRHYPKKGTEYCANASKCNTHKILADYSGDHFYPEVKSFKSIKYFRKCKDYKNGD